MRIISYYPNVFTGSGPAYTAGSIASEMAGFGADIEFVTPWCTGTWPAGVKGRSFARLRLPYRLITNSPLFRLARSRVERAILSEIGYSKGGTILHLWPGANIAFIKAAKAAGATIVREMINTHEGYAKRILDEESKRIGLPAQHTITQGSVDAEQACLQECDLILSPSKIVDHSLQEFGFGSGKVDNVSFGWDPAKFAGPTEKPAQKAETEELTALFVGSVGMRKGAHLALKAWVEAGMRGRFVLLGRVEPDFAPILEKYTGRFGIEHHDFVSNPQSYFHSADFFLFPTFEEGAPLVCYEAAGCGLPIVTTVAGTARMVEDDVNGIVVASGSEDALVAAIRRVSDETVRSRMSAAALQTAEHFTWRDAARQRLDTLRERFGA